MDEISQPILHGVAGLFAMAAGLCRYKSEEKEYQSVGQLLALGGVSGFIGFTVVGFLQSDMFSVPCDPWFLWALAAASGLSGKEGLKIVKAIYHNTIARILGLRKGTEEDEGDSK